jgi:hypothetical protein
MLKIMIIFNNKKITIKMANTEKMVAIKNIKSLPGYPIGSEFFSNSTGDILYVNDNGKSGKALGFGFDKEFFKKVEIFKVPAGYYYEKPSSIPKYGKIKKHLLVLSEPISIEDPRSFVTLLNQTTNQIVKVLHKNLCKATVYKFISSKGILQTDVIEFDPELFKLRAALGIAGTAEEMRAKIKEAKILASLKDF